MAESNQSTFYFNRLFSSAGFFNSLSAEKPAEFTKSCLNLLVESVRFSQEINSDRSVLHE